MDLRRNQRLLRHFVVIVDCCWWWIFCWRHHRLGWRIWRCQWSGGRRWRWAGIGKEDTFEWDAVHFKFHNQLRFARWWIFCDEREANLTSKCTINLRLLTFADDFELHPVQHRRSKIFQSILLLVVRWKRSVMTAVLNVRRVWSIHWLVGNFRRRHMRVVVADVMMIIVHGTFTIQVAICANQASFSRWNVIIVHVAQVAFSFDGNDRWSSGWDGRGWSAL